MVGAGIGAEIGDILSVLEIHRPLGPVVKDDRINLAMDFLFAFEFHKRAAVAALDERFAPSVPVRIGNRCAHCDRIILRDVAEAVLLGLVAVPAAEKQIAAESCLKHIGSIVSLASHDNGVVIRHIVHILYYIFIGIFGYLPVGETVDIADV